MNSWNPHKPSYHQLRLMKLPSAIIWLFDAISIEFLDCLPNAVTISAIVLIFSVSQFVTVFLLRFFHGLENEAVTVAAIMFSSIGVGAPIVGFGQLQYRRARLAYFNSQRLSEQLMLARDEAQAANAAKSRFLASMSHELRTPLNTIIGFSEIIRDETFGPAGVRRYLDYANDIHNSGHHLLNLINDVLDLSKIESGRESTRRESDIDLNLVIDEIRRLMQMTAEKSRIDLSAKLPNQHIKVLADGRMVRQILMNLISNAIKFTPENGQIAVQLSMQKSGAVIEVIDSGIGMTPQELQIALQPFGQIDSFQARKHQGTGLGLPLVNAMVELHGGTMTIRSTPGEGTNVSFNVPSERIIATEFAPRTSPAPAGAAVCQAGAALARAPF